MMIQSLSLINSANVAVITTLPFNTFRQVLGYALRWNGSMRKELLNENVFFTLNEVFTPNEVLPYIDDWMLDYSPQNLEAFV
jgi:hypothetical protein